MDTNEASAKRSGVPSTIAIIGAGVAGLALSIGLTRHGIPHKIYESANSFSSIGAGITLSPNALTALTLIDPRMRDIIGQSATRNESQARKNTWLSFRYGMADSKAGDQPERKFGDLIEHVEAFSATECGFRSFHRAKVLEGLVQLIPDGVVEFGMTLTKIKEVGNGVEITFSNGTTNIVSAVIGCDGIRSRVREHVLGPESQPTFADEYCYRSLIEREKVRKIIGDEASGNGTLYCGEIGFVILYPVNDGQLVNFVAVRRTDDRVWPHKEWIVPYPRDEMFKDLEGWGQPILDLLEHVEESHRWALFDSPTSSPYNKGRVCLMGDAAHASLPHLGAGAGMAFEDALILSDLLAHGHDNSDLEKSLSVYDKIRRGRSQNLVDKSRESGRAIQFVQEGILNDIERLREKLKVMYEWIWKVDLPEELQRGRRMMRDSILDG